MSELWGLNEKGQTVIKHQPDVNIDQIPETNWTDEEWETFRSWLKDVLQTGTAEVTFTKKDGTERVMKCTLRPELLPVQEITENKQTKKKNDTILSVFDVENNGWRSFTIRTVKRVTFKIN